MQVSDLQHSNGYRLLKSLRHEEILEFIREEMRQQTWIVRLFIWLNILLIGSVLVMFILEIRTGALSFWQVTQYFLLGMLAAMTLFVPIHEWLHGMAYGWAGAKSVSYGGNLKKFYFYAVAHKFVVDRPKFVVVALTPFIVITILTVIGIYLANPLYEWFWWGVLLMHTTACVGDFGIVNFYNRHKQQEIYTYDDIEEKTSYFYKRVSAEEHLQPSPETKIEEADNVTEETK